DGAGYHEDVEALYAAIGKAHEVTDQPSLIVLKTIMAWPAPNAQNTEKAHGSALGDDEVAATKKVLGFDPEAKFAVPDGVLDHTRKLLERGKAAHDEWQKAYAEWAAANAEGAALVERLEKGQLPDGLADALPVFEADAKGIATRAASGKVINALAPVLPELWGGSADLAGSNNTTISGVPSAVPKSRTTRDWEGDPYAGRVLHFGIREHGMGAIMNGIAAHGDTRVYGGTFFTFSDYMRGAVRVGALSKLPVIHVWTHDSVGLGEDGPTHQPIEHLAAVRAIPGLDVVRPADANETAAAWLQALEHTDRPTALILTRQNVPTFPRGKDGYADVSGVAKGGYVLLDSPTDKVDVVLLGTGSEVQYAVAAREELAKEGIGARVVSLPCLEWFEEQPQSYRDEVIPPAVKARVSVEAGVKQGWREYVGDAGRIISIDHYGASASGSLLFKEFGFTPEAVIAAAKDTIAAAQA
ncbi:MAG: transketolase, partial [Nocardioides sp.]|nr:transketolase [Nocardioides sp.]